MILMVVLCALVAVGAVAIWRWGGLDVMAPWERSGTWPLPPIEALRRYIWYVTVGLASGVVSGLVTYGVGGRLAMRLLAVTAGAEAQGRVTEADQIVGEITLGGTLGFIGFFGIFSGAAVGLIYMLVQRWLPPGRWGGLTFGLLQLILVATRADPLRPDNRDFDIVGPGWLSVAVFSAVMLGQGMLVAAIAGRYSRALPLIRKDLRMIARYVPAYVVIGPIIVVFLVPILVAGGLTLLASRAEGLDRVLASPRTMWVGRALGIAALAIAAPGFVIAITDIATRS